MRAEVGMVDQWRPGSVGPARAGRASQRQRPSAGAGPQRAQRADLILRTA